jgi:spore coat protein JB
MDTTQKKMLREIQALEFSLVDLHLFLNTHPHATEALNLYKEYLNMLEETKCEYERRYGPISPDGCGLGENSWEWALQPWPWHQYEGGMKRVDV